VSGDPSSLTGVLPQVESHKPSVMEGTSNQLLSLRLENDSVRISSVLTTVDYVAMIPLVEIRQELLRTVGSRWSVPRKMGKVTGEGVYCERMDVSVLCTLRTMQRIANFVRTCVNGSEAMSILSFSRISRCSLAVSSITVLVHSLRHNVTQYVICDVLRLRDESDYNGILSQSTGNEPGACVILMGSAGQARVMKEGHQRTLNLVVVESSVMRTLPFSVAEQGHDAGSVENDGQVTLTGFHTHVFEQQRVGVDVGVGCHTTTWSVCQVRH